MSIVATNVKNSGLHNAVVSQPVTTSVLNLKSVGSQIPDIIGGTQKMSAVPGYAHAPLLSKFLKDFSSDASYECTCQI